LVTPQIQYRIKRFPTTCYRAV